jgi:cell division transport system permease protein
VSVGAQLHYFVRSAWGSMVRSPFVHLISIAALCLSLVSFGLARIAAAQFSALLQSLGGEVEMTVYLAPDAPPEKVAELEQALTARSEGSVRRVSPAEALATLQQQLGDDGRALDGLGENPLPPSLEVQVAPSLRTKESLREMAQRVSALPFVTGVDYGAEALERLQMIQEVFSLAAWLVFGIVFLTTVVIVSATLQLAIFARREEIEIQKLVGATDGFVRIPFLLEGLTQGVVAAVLALTVLGVFSLLLNSERAGALAFLRTAQGFSFDAKRLGFELVTLGALLGLLGSFIAVRRFLRL